MPLVHVWFRLFILQRSHRQRTGHFLQIQNPWHVPLSLLIKRLPLHGKSLKRRQPTTEYTMIHFKWRLIGLKTQQNVEGKWLKSASQAEMNESEHVCLCLFPTFTRQVTTFITCWTVQLYVIRLLKWLSVSWLSPPSDSVRCSTFSGAPRRLVRGQSCWTGSLEHRQPDRKRLRYSRRDFNDVGREPLSVSWTASCNRLLHPCPQLHAEYCRDKDSYLPHRVVQAWELQQFVRSVWCLFRRSKVAS